MVRLRARRVRVRAFPFYRGPALTVDGVWFDRGRVLLVRRGHPPFRGRYALPGGFVEAGESAERAVVREVAEETGLRGRPVALVGFYSRPGRDPRGPTASAAFLLRGRAGHPRSGSDARGARWVPLGSVRALAFDHAHMLADARRLARSITARRTANGASTSA